MIVIVSFVIVKMQINKISKAPDGPDQHGNPSKYRGLLYIAPGLGIVLAAISRRNTFIEDYVTIGMIFILYLVYIFLAAKFIHKYLFIKANISYARFQKTSKKEKAKFAKNRVVIK